MSEKAAAGNAAVAFAGFAAIQWAALAAYRAAPHRGAGLGLAADLVPSAVVLALLLTWRFSGAIAFPIGTPRKAFANAPFWWLLFACVAAGAAFAQGVFGPHSWTWRADLFGGGVLEAPIVEELVFRGALQTSLNATALGRTTILYLRGGTIVAALAFGCSHFLLLAGGVSLARTLFEVGSAIPAGLLFGYLYQRTRNLWYGIFVHALGNLAGA
jgi:membrane protease YdiL (CAAX protease family)